MINLRERRHALGLSLFQMAVRMNVTPGTPGNWERTVPPLDRVADIAKAYELTESQVEQYILDAARRMRQADPAKPEKSDLDKSGKSEFRAPRAAASR